MNLRPYRYIWLNGNFGYENSKYDPKPSRNYGTSIGFTMLPIILSSAYFSFTRIETGYEAGNYYSGNLNKDFFEGVLNLGLGYKHGTYDFIQSSTPQLLQNIGSWIYPSGFIQLLIYLLLMKVPSNKKTPIHGFI